MEVIVKNTSKNLAELLATANITLSPISRQKAFNRITIFNYSSNIIYLNSYNPAVLNKGGQVGVGLALELTCDDVQDLTLIASSNSNVGLLIF